ncbi:MAG: TrmH family RNA methyltransferase [Pseudomonadota bacterium]
MSDALVERASVGVLLVDPKYPRNVGAAVRSCAAYGVTELRYTGERMSKSLAHLSRLPREERFRGYKSVRWRRAARPFDEFAGFTPVAVEVRMEAESLPSFEHPERPLYVFGPEDGSIDSAALRHCHRFVAIPTRHCLNLAMAVATVLYDRQAKAEPAFRMDMAETEGRGRRSAAG